MPMPTLPTDQDQQIGKAHTKEEFVMMQEIGKRLIKTYSEFADEKKTDVSWEVFLGAVDYVIKCHRLRANQMLGSFLKLEAAATEYGIDIEEPYTTEIKAFPSPIITK